MKTNFQMLKELMGERKFTPKRRGVLSGEEVDMIETTLCLSDMDILQLRNLRDFAVVWFDSLEDVEQDFKYMDIMSGVTAVIDRKILGLGGEV